MATIPLAAIASGADIAVGEGSVWISEGHQGHRVYRLDPKSNTIVATLPAGREPLDIGVVAGGLWVSGQGAIHRIDAATNTVSSIPFGGGGFTRVKVGADAVWAAFDYASEVSRIDPYTMSVSAVVPLPADSWIQVVGEGRVWVTLGPVGRRRFTSPEYLRGDVVESFSAISVTSSRQSGEAIAVGAFPHLTLGEGSLWVGARVPGQGDFLTRVDPQTLIPIGKSLRLPSFVSHLTVGFDSVWIVSSRDPSLILRVPICRRRWIPCSNPFPTGRSGPS